jgi:hypothetical protein
METEKDDDFFRSPSFSYPTLAKGGKGGFEPYPATLWCRAPRAKARGPSTGFVGRNPPKHTLLRSFGASKGTLLAFIHGLKTRGFLRRRVKKVQITI